MQRIRTVLQKLTEMAQRNPDRTLIDVDLMLDYTRVIYADLLELRGGMAYKPQPNIHEPTLDEMTRAMEQEQQQEEVPPAVTFPEPVIAAAPKPATAMAEAAPIPLPAATGEVPKPLIPLPPMPAAPKPGKDIRRYIDLNDKYLFLSELFNNDLRLYEETMNTINTCMDKQQARQMLGTKFTDENNSAYDSFQQVLERFFE